MRKFLVSLAFGALWVTLAPENLTACGDKYIRLAARLGPAYTAAHTARVLIYMPAGSVVPAAASKIGLHDSLKRAGHNVYAISREADLAAALNVRQYDIVIADAASAAALAPALERAPGRPTLVPVFHNRTQRELDDARKQGRCLIASRERAYHAVAEIDHVMQLRKTAPAGL